MRIVVTGSSSDIVSGAAPPVSFTPSRYQRFVKPAIDRTAAVVLLVLLVPLMAAVALAVRLSMGRGVLFRQRRVGEGGREFTMLKFRSMLDPSQVPEAQRGPCPCGAHKCVHDPRHTPVGRLLRKLSLDELPQLVNVARGEMSLVGPRPELPGIVAGYAPWMHQRHLVRPGMTGLWQVSARRPGVLMHETGGPDVEYVRTISLRTDLVILARTVPALLRRDGH